MQKALEVQIPRHVYNKVMHWVNKSSDEVSGFGKVTYYEETGVFYIHDAYLIKQTNGSAHTDIDGGSLAKLMYQTRETEGELKWWWHSHVKMNVFWSGTDTATIKELGSQGWILATVFNQREEHRSALGYGFKVLDAPMIHQTEAALIKDELPFFIMDEIPEEETQAWDTEYDTNVEKKTYTPVTSYYGNYDLYDDDDAYARYQRRVADRDLQQGRAASKDFDQEMYQFYVNMGYMGAGAYEEAKAVGMTFSAYMDTLMKEEDNFPKELEDKLEMAVATGVLKVRKTAGAV